jgi:DNA-binding beta-propeller fold protein YncE
MGNLRKFVCCAVLISIYIPNLVAQSVPTLVLSKIVLPGNPFGVVVTQNQRWVFVSIAGNGPDQKTGIAVLKSNDGLLSLQRVVLMTNRPSGIALTHDGELLIAAAGDHVVFFDTARLISDRNDACLGWFSDGEGAGSIYVRVTKDDRILFVSDEYAQKLSVVDLAKFRSQKFKGESLLGSIPVGHSPVALVFSPDEHWLFTTSEVAPAQWGWPQILPRENGKPGHVPEGAVLVIDVAKAKLAARNSIVSRVSAGGSPVRLALSADGHRLFVSARNSNAVLVFDAIKLVTDPQHAKLAMVSVGSAPVPIVLVAEGTLAIIGNSDRFNAGKSSSLSILDTAKIEKGLDPILATIPCGAFPREFCLAPDGKTVFLTNYGASSLQIIDIEQLTHLRNR